MMTRQQKRIGGLLLLLALTALACNLGGGEEAAPAPTSAPAEPLVAVETVIVVATPTPAPTEAPAAADVPTLAPPPAPAVGAPTMTALVALNVRTGPGTNYGVVGALTAGTAVPIVGVSPDGGWWKIQCPAGAGAECWSSAGAAYSRATDTGSVPVAAVPPAPTQVAAASTATRHGDRHGDRHGHGRGDGDLHRHAARRRQPTATYTATPPNAPTATYTATPPNAPTATYTATPPLVAAFDNDSLQNPALDLFLSITGTREFTYSDEISFSQGDQDDWVEFEFPNNSNANQVVYVTLDCEYQGNVGNAQVRATVYEDQQQTSKIAICNTGEQQLTVNNTKTQQVRIHFGITNEGAYVTYTLRVVGFR